MKTGLIKKDKKLSLAAATEEDLVILSALSQDALVKTSNITWAKKKRRFVILLTRFCWEFNNENKKHNKRINSIISFDTVLAVQTKGIDQSKSNIILSLLTITYKSSSINEHRIELIFSGGGNITLMVECLEVILKDVSYPFKSASLSTPHHLSNSLE